MKKRIGIFGKYESDREPRKTIGDALDHSASKLGVPVEYEWIENTRISSESLKDFSGAFIAPGSAMDDSARIIDVIRNARENKVPCLGTCGGFQRMLTEYAINVLGHKSVLHEESTPDAVDPLFSKLNCSISSTFYEVIIKKDSRAYEIYQTESAQEGHYCSFGLNSKYEDEFLQTGMRISGTDEQGIARIVELADHPFFMGTLFVPQVSSTYEKPHPIITEFLSATIKFA